MACPLEYNQPMTIHILTLFPEFFKSVTQSSMLERAQKQQHVNFQITDIRDFSLDKHKTTDDRPYGGGPGMVMKIEPIFAALESILGGDPAQLKSQRETTASLTRVMLTSAKGKRFTQASARQYAQLEDLVIICGHYEGVDERVAQYLVDEEVRIGEYILTGGEPAALVIADAVTRLLPGVLGNSLSTEGESHMTPGFFAHPQYTRPPEFHGWEVPELLRNGHAANITQWRATQSAQAAELDESVAE